MKQQHFETTAMIDTALAKRLAKQIKHHGYVELSYNRIGEPGDFDDFRIVIWHEDLKEVVSKTIKKSALKWIEKQLEP